MNHILKSALMGSVVIAGFGFISPALAQYQLTVLHTNDFHARFEPISRFNGPCSVDDNLEGKCFGGSARLLTAIEGARERAENSLLLDGGDQFQGTLFYTYYKGQFTAEMMNRLGYDAMTVGNHEFDDGPEVLRGFMDTINFPILMSNADVSAEPLLAGVLQKSTILERGGRKIGLIGLTPEDTDELASPGKNVFFSDPVPAVQAEVDRLTAEGVNIIIVMSHSGYETDLDLAARTTGVDIIVAGHSNAYLSNVAENADGPYPTMVGNTAVVSAFAYGKFLGELNAVFDDDGNLTSATGEPLIMDASIVENTSVKDRVTEMAVPLEEIRQQVVAQTADAIEGDRAVCRVEECQMGNLVADAMLDRVKGQGITIAIQNGGGLRASIDSGEVTMGEVFMVLPFQNTLSTFYVSGATIIAALENGVSQVEEVKGRFPQVAGLQFDWDPTIAANEGRITAVRVRQDGEWMPIDPDAEYGVVSNNYVRNGGDGYSMFVDANNVYDFGPDLAEVVSEFLAKADGYTPYVDGRIAKQ
ncbi:5'-nucleotidase [hydrothermal vent metagenome]|uniref:5'-nucleotidase n=1 Tax=hydrothermal vent metagenome TaxID=652676 RepID=A0A3B0UKE4_9ZZZZ